MMPQKIFDDITFRIAKGQHKYGEMDSNQLCLGALTLEVAEVHEAIQQRKDWKVREELLDVACVAIRRAMAIDEAKIDLSARPVSPDR